ncbi:MAG: tetratricopeptide repeat protein [Proteobacteria bacterium]|nr:tetratricopeptide repeat protein [Pseudomonadota bacterium]
MSEEGVERKLTAILAADVVGYSRLMGEDEAGTLARLKSLRKELVQPKIAGGRGRIVKLMGDGLLAEFPSVVEAVRCAVDIQQDMAGREADLPDERRIRLRIGVNLGDIIVEGSDIYGDGVNVAARLEGLAEPGGICISGKVYEEVRNKLPTAFEDLGEQEVKNIREPVRVYRWTEAAADPMPGMAGAEGVLPLPDKPSIAVLPFTNMSGDPEQEYFADGMAEDIITDLSKISGLFVISRNSSFAYKGKAPDVRQVGRELGVRYVLEGSVRRAGDQVRINTQLIDAETGGHLWAERYDGVMTDVFALQDEVTSKIISALAVRLTGAERLNLARMPTEDLEAYDSFLRAERGLFSQNSKGLAEALSLYHRATKIDPMFARAWAGHARAAVDVWRFDWFDVMPGHAARRQAYDSAARALSLDPSSARAYSVLAILQMVDGRYDEAIESARKAISLNPNDADSHLNLALVLSYGGEHDKAVRAMKAALRLNPKPPSGVYRLSGFILLMAHRYEQAINLLIKARNTTPSDPSHEELAMAYAQLGRLDEAKAEVDGMLKLWPAANLTYYRVLYAHHKREEDLDFRIAALRKAGLPQWPYDYDGRAENRLKGSEIQRLIHDRNWYGHRVGAEEFIRENTKDGLVKFRDPKAHPGRSRSAYLLQGTVSIDGDMLCYRYEEFLLGRRYCGYVYRNPEGSHGEKNAYVDVNAIVIDYFTVNPERRAKSDNISGQE